MRYQAGLRALPPTRATSAASHQETIFRAQTDKRGGRLHFWPETFLIMSSGIKAERLLKDLKASLDFFLFPFLKVRASQSLCSRVLVKHPQSPPNFHISHQPVPQSTVRNVLNVWSTYMSVLWSTVHTFHHFTALRWNALWDIWLSQVQICHILASYPTMNFTWGPELHKTLPAYWVFRNICLYPLRQDSNLMLIIMVSQYYKCADSDRIVRETKLGEKIQTVFSV